MTTDTGKMEHGIQQSIVDGFLLADGTRSSEQGGAFSFQADIGMNPETTPQITAR